MAKNLKTSNKKKKPSTRSTPKKRRVIQRSDWHVLGGLLVFTGAALLTMAEEVSAFEEAIFAFFYAIPEPLIPVFLVITQFGSIYMLGALALVYLFVKRYVIVIRLLMAGTMAYLLAGVGKDLFGRGRPNELFEDIVFHDFMVRGPGFPSGHTALAVALGTVLLHHTPRSWRWPILILTFLAAISRMVLGVHTPLDVVGGVAIGYIAAMLFRHVTVIDRS
jgi:undecaprenyl-diphosphatase